MTDSYVALLQDKLSLSRFTVLFTRPFFLLSCVLGRAPWKSLYETFGDRWRD